LKIIPSTAKVLLLDCVLGEVIIHIIQTIIPGRHLELKHYGRIMTYFRCKVSGII